MQCPVCKDYKLGPVALLEGLNAAQCPNCKGVFISSNDYMAWWRTLGSAIPAKEGAIEIDPNWDVPELKLCRHHQPQFIRIIAHHLAAAKQRFAGRLPFFLQHIHHALRNMT